MIAVMIAPTTTRRAPATKHNPPGTEGAAPVILVDNIGDEGFIKYTANNMNTAVMGTAVMNTVKEPVPLAFMGNLNARETPSHTILQQPSVSEETPSAKVNRKRRFSFTDPESKKRIAFGEK